MANILVADDNEIKSEYVSKILKEEGHSIFVAEHSDQVFTILEKNEISMIIMSVELPGLSSKDFLEEIFKSDFSLPLIVMGDELQIEVIEMFLKEGAQNFLLKPINKETLLRAAKQSFEFLAMQKDFIEIVKSINKEHISFEIRTKDLNTKALIQILTRNLIPFGICLNENIQRQIRIAVDEAITNAIDYGNLELAEFSRDTMTSEGISEFAAEKNKRLKDPRFCNRLIKIDYQFRDKYVQYEITNEGKGFNVNKTITKVKKQGIFRMHGKGLILIKSFMDDVSWSHKGRTIRMKKSQVIP